MRATFVQPECGDSVLTAAAAADGQAQRAMDHLIDAVTTSSCLLHSIVSGAMATTSNQLIDVRRRLLGSDYEDTGGSEAGSVDSQLSDRYNQFLILTEDHFSELMDEDLDSTGVRLSHSRDCQTLCN